MRTIFAAILVSLAPEAGAQTLSFPEIWSTIRQASPAQEAAQLDAHAAEAGRERASRHWLPRLYLDAKTYRTNDPGTSLFGLLEQRKITSTDFSPDSLNNPEDRTFARGALGVDLPLYEGGMKSARVSMMEHVAAAGKATLAGVVLEQYASSGQAYGTIAALRRQKSKLQDLNNEIERLMKSYQLGQKSNPVGYSGLLGMKSLAHRVAGLIEQMEAQERAANAALKEMGAPEGRWTPQEMEARQFVDRYLIAEIKDGESHKITAGRENAKAAEEGALMERARHLPRVGAFAESHVFNGSRDTATGYTAGLYLQWSLFDPSDLGAYREARLKAQAAARMNQALAQKERAERSALAESDRALRANLARLEDSDRLLAEQTRVSATLFRNGSMSALQFVEILNRRTDLISQETEAELGLIQAASARLMTMPSQIGGGK